MKTIFMIFVAAALQAQEPAPTGVKLFTTRVEPGAGTVGFVAGTLVGGTPVTGAPYSAQAVNETVQVLADGNRIAHSSSSTLYRDSLGRERREETLPSLGGSNQPFQTIFIADPVAGVNYSLDPQTRTAHKMPSSPMPTVAKFVGKKLTAGILDARTVTIMGGPGLQTQNMFYATTGGALPTPKIEQLGTTTIEGVLAEGTRTTTTIPAGQIGNERAIDVVSESWFSPELQMTIQSKQSDPRMGESSYKLTNINRSEPLHSLFEPPADYTLDSGPAVRVREE